MPWMVTVEGGRYAVSSRTPRRACERAAAAPRWNVGRARVHGASARLAHGQKTSGERTRCYVLDSFGAEGGATTSVGGSVGGPISAAILSIDPLRVDTVLVLSCP